MRRNLFTPSSSPVTVEPATATLRALTLGALLLLNGTGALALPDDASQPMHIEAEQAEIDQHKRQFIYTGEVTVKQGTLSVTADHMVVDYVERDSKQTVTRITATGNPAHYSQQLEEDEGRVWANARKIVYHTENEKIDLKGNAHLTQLGNEISGETINYDVTAGRVDASSGTDARTKMILTPASSGQNASKE
ncbi:MAG: lipopolysaccharide transport periplasmic protein LptA [Pseudomonadales bacterium]|nr:lipopolysaccharide transport periplasmic protein LptA [Pseudomonadales bacterium]MDP6470847.1 lipopolysaccharide transport periplasmic protein LptA [Pseudomonadales bacterium]MDP6825968.1 lipopolysaccharide transport periplasmic protein LptA [Pseudomonadales bacterium]MDP6972280.1 lipopolysaccharide transport periplasmic protein LptA [Pseudomonadales bacterium]